MNESLKENHKPDFENFKDEIRELIKKELTKKKLWEERGMTGEAFSPDIICINPDTLTEDDQLAYKSIKNETLTWDMWNAYTERYFQDIQKLDPSIRDGRDSFRAFLGNKAHGILNKDA